MIARLRPGVTLAQAAAALGAETPRSTIYGPAPALFAWPSSRCTTTRPALRRTQSVRCRWRSALILLIACVNVAGLMLARGATRDVELAIRASIGAGRGRLIRQLLTESLLLALAGAATGVLVAYAALDSLVALIPLSLPANSPVTINATVLAFALGLTVVTALLFGLVPALKLSRAPKMISTMLSVGGRGGAPLSRRAGQWLIAVEVTLALVLMSCSGLILRSFAKLVSVDLGFDSANVLTLEVEPLDQSAALRRQYYPLLADALRRLPEVASVGAIDQLSLIGGGSYGFPRRTLVVTLRDLSARCCLATSRPWRRPSRDVCSTTRIADWRRSRRQRRLVAAILRWQRDRPHAPTRRGKRQWRIIGVVPNIRHSGPDGGDGPEDVRTAGSQGPENAPMTLAMVMRLRGARPCPDRLKQVAESLGPRVLVGKVRPAADLVSEQIARPRIAWCCSRCLRSSACC